MPATLQVGSSVSSSKAKSCPMMPMVEGTTRRRRQRIFGTILRSVPGDLKGGMWEVLWANGKVEVCPKNNLKHEKAPDEESMNLVTTHMRRYG